MSHNSTGNGVGGGIANTTAGSLLMLTASTIRDNSANYLGGGLYNSATMTVTSSTVSGNSAANGGGFLNYGRLTLTASTITGNSATSGGGVFNYNTLTLTASTITGNAASSGGGILNYSRLTLTNSLVAKNLSGRDCDTINTVGSSITSLGYNLDSDGSCQLTGSTDWPGIDPLLGPVQNNGGLPRTHALLPGSPAVDAIPWGTNGCGTTLISDQRWQARPQPAGGACDIGAYEVTVAGQPLSAWMTGLTPDTAVCKNVTTGQEVTLNDPVVPWDCEAAGLAVTSGDHITLRVRGPVQQGATDVGGAVVGVAPRSGGCTNRTTGQQVTFQHMVGATAGSCVAAGLVVQPGDHVQIHVQGVAE